MPSSLVPIPSLPFAEPAKVQATGTDQISQDFEFMSDCILEGLCYTKPADTVLSVNLVFPSQGGSDFVHTIPVLAIAAEDSATSGLELSGLAIPRRGKGKLSIATSGGSSGNKEVTLLARSLGGVR